MKVTITTHVINTQTGNLFDVYFNNVTKHGPDYLNFWYEVTNNEGQHRVKVTDVLAVVEEPEPEHG